MCPRTEDDVEIALREAIANAVLHGNRQDPRKRVHIFCHFEPGEKLSIIVKDEGSGFDPTRIPDPLASENLMREHGRGIFLMRMLMDEVRFHSDGNEVHMLKRVSPTIH